MSSKIRGICAPYTPSNGRSLAVTSATSTSAETLATNSARLAFPSAVYRFSEGTPTSGPRFRKETTI